MSKINHKDQIEQLINSNDVFVFMKGDQESPQCGFSALVVAIFKKLQVAFGSFDVLRDQAMRQAIKDYTEWPTIPQIFIKGEFIGGSDILQELYDKGELKKMVQGL